VVVANLYSIISVGAQSESVSFEKASRIQGVVAQSVPRNAPYWALYSLSYHIVNRNLQPAVKPSIHVLRASLHSIANKVYTPKASILKTANSSLDLL
jgi:hypothetical protein